MCLRDRFHAALKADIFYPLDDGFFDLHILTSHSRLYALVKIQRSQLMPELKKQVAFGDIAEDFQRAVRHTKREKRAVIAGADMAHGVYHAGRHGYSLAVGCAITARCV